MMLQALGCSLPETTGTSQRLVEMGVSLARGVNDAAASPLDADRGVAGADRGDLGTRRGLGMPRGTGASPGADLRSPASRELLKR